MLIAGKSSSPCQGLGAARRGFGYILRVRRIDRIRCIARCVFALDRRVGHRQGGYVLSSIPHFELIESELSNVLRNRKEECADRVEVFLGTLGRLADPRPIGHRLIIHVGL